jgi:protein phosphatase
LEKRGGEGLELPPVPSSPQAEPAPPLLASGHTHPGRKREDNEDAFSIAEDLRLFSVADGMGGRAGGGLAARMAVQELEAFARARHAAPRAPWPFPIDRRNSLGANLLRVGLQVANQKIREAGTGTGMRRMGATFAALAVGNTHIVVAHLGDVRVYRLRGDTLKRLTRDHSLAEEVMAARGQVNPQPFSGLAQQNVVTRALGIKDDVDPTVYVNTFNAGDLYLLCSDGLWTCVPDEYLGNLLRSYPDPDSAGMKLIDAANSAGGPDNVTALLVRVG